MRTRGQPTTADAAHRSRVVSHDGHRELHPSSVPPFVAQLPGPPAQQAGNETFHHRAAIACRAGQLRLTGGAFAKQARSDEQLLDGPRGRRRCERFDCVGNADGKDPTGVESLVVYLQRADN